MEVLYPRCCGLDVHKSSITACILLAQSGKPQKQVHRLHADKMCDSYDELVRTAKNKFSR